MTDLNKYERRGFRIFMYTSGFFFFIWWVSKVTVSFKIFSSSFIYVILKNDMSKKYVDLFSVINEKALSL